MTGLLVSVRSAAEAKTALAGGADIIDVKEPRRGPLGPADPIVWSEISEVVGRRAPLSVALGEWMSDATVSLAGQAAGFTFAKVGLSSWRRAGLMQWSQIRQALRKSIILVPVVYADAIAAGCRSFLHSAKTAIRLANDTRSPLLLIDTFEKRGRTLLDHVSISQLQNVVDQAATSDIRVVLAGSLTESAIEQLLPLAPAYIGVRGAACVGGRDGTIDLACVKSLARRIAGARQKAAS